MIWTELEHIRKTRNRARRFTAALVGSLLVHGLILGAFLLRKPAPPAALHARPDERTVITYLPPAPRPLPPPPEPVPEPAPEPVVEEVATAPPERKKPDEEPPEEAPDPFADLPALWWQRETIVVVMDRFRRGVTDPDSCRIPLVRHDRGPREYATAALNDHFRKMRFLVRAEAAKRALQESFPYLDE